VGGFSFYGRISVAPNANMYSEISLNSSHLSPKMPSMIEEAISIDTKDREYIEMYHFVEEAIS
jgi:hypothetical protein